MTTIGESRTLRHLEDAWNSFASLPVMHPDDADEFRRAIHAAQNILAWRVAVRADPARWGEWPKPKRGDA